MPYSPVNIDICKKLVRNTSTQSSLAEKQEPEISVNEGDTVGIMGNTNTGFEYENSHLLPKKKFYPILFCLCMLYFISALDTTILATAYIDMSSKFGALSSGMWIITSYLIATAAVQPLYGKFSDVFGRVESILFSITVFTIGSILCAVSQSIGMLIASRAIQGIGGGGLLTMPGIVMSDIVSERMRGKYAGFYAGSWGVASAIGPILGGAIVENASWRIIFWINLPVCIPIAAFIVFALRLPKPGGSKKEKLLRIDVVGIVALMCSLIPLLLAFSWAGQGHEWSSKVVLVFLIIGIVFIPVFLYVEWMVSPDPVLPLRLFKIRNVCASMVCHFFGGTVLYSTIMFMPMWETSVAGASNIDSGLRLLPLLISMVVAATLSGIVLMKSGRYCTIIYLYGILMVVGTGLLVLLDVLSGLGKRIGFLILIGFGYGLCVQPILLAAQCAVDGTDMATITTILVFLRTLGGVFALSILESTINQKIQNQINNLIMLAPKYKDTIEMVVHDQSYIHGPDLPKQIQDLVVTTFQDALHGAFIGMTVFAAINAVSAFGFKHVPLYKQRKETIKV